MWCILRCQSEKTEQIMESCRRNISGQVLRDVFTFTYERMRRYEGSWHTETRSMFPGYIFLETEKPDELSEALEPYRGVVSVMENDRLLLRVQPEEEELLRSLCGREHHLAMSQGYIRDGITHITEGPLVGMERRIRRIDRHKRLADIASPVQGMEGPVQAGLEITSKS